MTNIDQNQPPSDIFTTDEPITEALPPVEPLYRIYEDSKIAVGKGVGKMWKQRFDAARKAYEIIDQAWTKIFEYYNFHHQKTLQTHSGSVFRPGDGTENILFSNLNILLPAVYGKDPDVTCSTTDEQDEPFTHTLQSLLNALFRRKTALNAKQKIKKAAGVALLTNLGVLKLDWTKKDDSREMAVAEMQRISDELASATDVATTEELYGQLEALEQNMEVLKPSGPQLSNILSQNMTIDPYAELPDGTDGEWMIEKAYINTASLTQRFTKPDPDQEGEPEAERVLVYKPTHKASFTSTNRDEDLGLVMEAINRGANDVVTHTEDERTAYLGMYFTECYYIWDKRLKRVYLFHRDDWTWPIWVWDDPLVISRFFPYFLIGYSMSTGGTVTVGEYAYILDQQDEVNEINKKLNQVRRAFFNFFMFDSDAVSQQDAEKFINALRGEIPTQKHLIGVSAQGKDVEKMIQAVGIPLGSHAEVLFNKPELLDTINRLTNTSDAIRGVQFKTNTNVAAVNTYQESMRLSIGAKVDVIEDIVADIAQSVAELAVQNWDAATVSSIIGENLGKDWQQMSLGAFLSQYNVDIAAGSMEKPNSVFKKKEAIEVAQAIGQFAQAAPGATLQIMLRVLQQAFTEIVIKPEDWNAISAEIQANLSKGVSTGGQPQGEAGAGLQQMVEQAKNLPPEIQNRVVQMDQQGVPPQQIAAFIKEQIGASGNGRQRQSGNGLGGQGSR